MTSDLDSAKDIDSLDIYKKALDDLGAFLEPSEMVQSDLQNFQNQSEVSDQSRLISKSLNNDKKPKISEFEEIFNRLLVIFTARDRVQKSLLSNVLENSSNVEIEIHQLDRQLRNNLRTINCKIKPKIKIDIMKSLAEFKAQRTVSSNDWWWNYQLDLGWHYWRIWNGLALFCLGLSAVVLYKIIYGLTTGQILLQVNLFYGGATLLLTTISGMFGIVGLKDIIVERIKKLALSFFEKANNVNSSNSYSFFKPLNSFVVSLSSLVLSGVTLFGLPVLLNNRSAYWPSKGSTFEKAKQDLNQSVYSAILDSQTLVIRDNLAQLYLNAHDYENAEKEYKALLPDFNATVELLRLHLLKLDNDKNKEISYNDYTNYLTYVLNVSYFETYCTGKEKNQVNNEDNDSLLKSLAILAQTTVETKIEGCKLNYQNLGDQKPSKEAYQSFLRPTFQLLKMRGWANLDQGQYSQAKVDLESAWYLADQVFVLLQKHIEIIKQQIAIADNHKYLDLQENMLILDDAKNTLSKWERRKAESACLLVQLFKRVDTKKIKNNQSLYKKQCYSYKPFNSLAWQQWTYEYYQWSKPE